MAGIFVPFKRVGSDGGNVNFTTEVARKVAEMGSLLNDGSSTDRIGFSFSCGFTEKEVWTDLLDLSHQSGLAMA